MTRLRSFCSISECGKPCRGHGYCNAHYLRFKRHGNPYFLTRNTPNGAPIEFIEDVAANHHTDDCILWPFAKTNAGYPVITIKKKTIYVHRYICMIVHGSPENRRIHAAHSCGNGHLGCCNPKHLSWKTAKQNSFDRIAHGTSRRGERHNFAKLTEDDVRQIKTLRGHLLQREIADLYNVTQVTICDIFRGKSWTWLE